jgi:Uma2 family endonuclease
MATKPAIQHWTYAEYARLPDDGNRYEVVAGEVFVTPSPHPKHQLAVGRISGLFEAFTRAHGVGQLYPGPIDVLLSESDYLVPDLVFVREERDGIISDRGLEAAPDLVIEIISPSTGARDRGLKRERYARFGVPLYWIVDVARQHVEVYRLAEDPNGGPEIVRDDLVWHPTPGGPALTLPVPFIVGADRRV